MWEVRVRSLRWRRANVFLFLESVRVQVIFLSTAKFVNNQRTKHLSGQTWTAFYAKIFSVCALVVLVTCSMKTSPKLCWKCVCVYVCVLVCWAVYASFMIIHFIFPNVAATPSKCPECVTLPSSLTSNDLNWTDIAAAANVTRHPLLKMHFLLFYLHFNAQLKRAG